MNRTPTASTAQTAEHLREEPASLEFINGNPTPEDIAAVTAIVMTVAAEAENGETNIGTRRAQNRRARLGLRLRPGLGAWRRTLPFR
ncbi:MAG: acyl-CoA carboxylase subunit epsilon [Kocuria sp.]|nr:acyl-CoA carboxylase subunit epsilon [Kocuria sp.]